MKNNFPTEIRAYRPVCLCGRGAFGAVWLVTDGVGRKFALKIVFKSSLGGSWEREFRGLRYYQNQVTEHPNLIRIFHIEDCRDLFYYTMECADNLPPDPAAGHYFPATLENRLQKEGRLPPQELRDIFGQLLDGLEHLHDAGLIHRDIKPENILFIGGVPKLGDIGLVSSVTHTLSLAGTQTFIPPEYLTGRERVPKPELDLYALGKTLYRAFSGQSPEDFPLVPHSVLEEPDCRVFNQLAKHACAVMPLARLKTIEEFRSELRGERRWTAAIRRISAAGLLLLRVPLLLPVLAAGFLARRKWILILLLLAVVGWLGIVAKNYVQLERIRHPYDYGFHADTLLQAFATWHVQITGYDLYDFHRKDAATIRRYGERRLVSKEEYLRAKNPGIPAIPDLTLEVGDPEEEGSLTVKKEIRFPEPEVIQTTPLRGEYLYEPAVTGLNASTLDAPHDTVWTGGIMTLPPAAAGAKLRYRDELPLRSEIRFCFRPYGFRGTLELDLTAAEYVPRSGREMPEIPIRRQIRYRLHSNGKKLSFEPVLYRDQDVQEEDLAVIGQPKVREIELEDRFYEMRILLADDCRRVYLDGNLIWATHTAFYGGYFSMRYWSGGEGGLQWSDFAIHDTRFVQSGEVRRSRLVLPERRALSGRDERLRTLQWVDGLFPPEFLSMPRILTDFCYGATESVGSTFSRECISLQKGKTYLFFLRDFIKPYRMNFSILFHDSETRLTLQPYAILPAGGERFHAGVLSQKFPIRFDAAEPDKPRRVDFVLTCESGSMTLTGSSDGRELFRAAFFLPADAERFRHGLIFDVHTRLELQRKP